MKHDFDPAPPDPIFLFQLRSKQQLASVHFFSPLSSPPPPNIFSLTLCVFLHSQEKALGKRAAARSQPLCRDPRFPTVGILLKVALQVMKFQSAHLPSCADFTKIEEGDEDKDRLGNTGRLIC
jgi:hypothetical protein